MIAIGVKAPEFALKDQNGKTVKLLLHWSHRDRTQCQGCNPRPLQPF